MSTSIEQNLLLARSVGSATVSAIYVPGRGGGIKCLEQRRASTARYLTYRIFPSVWILRVETSAEIEETPAFQRSLKFLVGFAGVSNEGQCELISDEFGRMSRAINDVRRGFHCELLETAQSNLVGLRYARNAWL